MKIIHRYVLREHAGPLAFALTALTSLLLLNYIAKRFGDLVGKGLEWSVIGEFFLLSIPFTIAMTLPMAIQIATLYAFSRLAAENEITALKASGVSMVRLLVPVTLAAGVLALVMVAFNDQILPRANHQLRVLQSDIARKKPTFALREQVINEVSPGQLYLRANHLDEFSNRMREVTIYDMSDQLRRRTIVADSGNMALAPNGRDLQLILYNGYMQEIPRQDPQRFQRLFFKRDLVRVANVANDFGRDTSDTYKSDREMSICELQGEVSKAESDFSRAKSDLEETLAAVTVELATGKPATDRVMVPPPSSGSSMPIPRRAKGATVTIERDRTLATAYCGLLDGVGRLARSFLDVPEAHAAGLPASLPVRQDTAKPKQDTTKPKPDTTKPGQDTTKPKQDTSAARTDSLLTPVLPQDLLPVPPVMSAPVTAPGVPLPESGINALAAIEAAKSRMVEGKRVMNENAVEIQKKFALSAACVVFVLVGAPIALRFPRGGVGLTMGVSLGVFAMYYVGLIAGESLANRAYLPPFLAMWAPNIILFAISLVMLSRMGREGSTSRGGDFSELLESARLSLGRFGRRMGLPLERRRRPA